MIATLLFQEHWKLLIQIKKITGQNKNMKIIIYLVDVLVAVYMCSVFLSPILAFIVFILMTVFGVNWCISNTKPKTIET